MKAAGRPQTTKPRHPCRYCDKSYMSKSSLMKHIQKKHKDLLSSGDQRPPSPAIPDNPNHPPSAGIGPVPGASGVSNPEYSSLDSRTRPTVGEVLVATAPATLPSGQVSTGNPNDAGDGPRKKPMSEPETEDETHHPKRRKDP